MNKIKLTYRYLNNRGKLVETDDRTKANNEAYWADNPVSTYYQGKLVDFWKPTKVDTSNLHDDFHNREIRKNK